MSLQGSRCLLGEADGALYMAFMGTKQRRDLVTNAQVLQEPIWPEDLSSDQQDASQVALHTALRPLIAGTYRSTITLCDRDVCSSV